MANLRTRERQLGQRGTDVMLPHGGLPEVVPSHLMKLIEATGGPTGPIGLQFISQPELEASGYEGGEQDPLHEDDELEAPGLIYKYRAKFAPDGTLLFPGRALFTATFRCAAYCRFCTRGREVGVPAGHIAEGESIPHSPSLSRPQIDEALDFIANEPGLNEVILSGGDPMTLRPEVLNYILSNLGDLQRSGKLDIVRIGTRTPVHNPDGVSDAHLEALQHLEHPRLMVHINHPAELTDKTRALLARMQKEAGGIIMSQSVLLRGVNDNVQTLTTLFRDVAKLGGIPYILYQNDPVYWAKHLTVPIEEAIALWQEVRPNSSGVAATARFVIDTPEGYGKIPIPEGNAWNVDYSEFNDFHGTTFPLR